MANSQSSSAAQSPVASNLIGDGESLRFLPTLSQFIALLVIYFGLFAVLRSLVSEVAGIDDVDQILRAQFWAWGYGPQPPLYTWLVRIFLGVFGYQIFSMMLLKEFIMFAIYLLTYATARRLTGKHVCGVVAAAALQFDGAICWESHRELTHTVLASAMVLAFIYLFLRLDRQRLSSYIVFGIGAGLGVLSKYNILFVYTAVLLAALSLDTYRPLILTWKTAVAVLIGLAICLPNLWWILHHHDLAFESVFKLKIQQAWGQAVLVGLTNWVEVLFVQLAPIILPFVLIFWSSLRRVSIRLPEEKLLARTLWWILALGTASIFVFKVTGFRARYLQPVLVWTPVWFVLLIRDYLTPARLKVLLGLSAVIALGILIIAPGRVLLTEKLNKPNHNEVLVTPYRQLARDLAPMVQRADCIIGRDHGIAGNLRLWFPEKLVIDPEVGPLFTPVKGSCVLVWGDNEQPPAELMKFVQSATGKSNVVDVTHFSEVLKYHHARTFGLTAGRVD